MANQYFKRILPLLAILTAPAILHADAAKSSDTPATAPAATQSAVKKISLAEFDAMRAEKDAVVLDVRTPKEFTAGHVPGAVNIDWHLRDFNERVGKLDKSKKYLVHCMAGGRSTAATQRMSTLDFPNLYNFTGGFSAWMKAEKPVEK